MEPIFCRVARKRLESTIIPACSALSGFHINVCDTEAPTLEALLGRDGAHVLSYVALQVQTLDNDGLRCGSPMMIRQDLCAFSRCAEHLAVEATLAGDRVRAQDWMRISQAYMGISKGINDTIPRAVPVRLQEDRFRNPYPVLKLIEHEIAVVSQLKPEDLSEHNAKRVRAALVTGVLGSVVGGHRPSQVSFLLRFLWL